MTKMDTYRIKSKVKLKKKDIKEVKDVTLKTSNSKDKIIEVKRKGGILDLNLKKNKLNFGFKGEQDLKKKPESSYIIEMLFSNGTCKQFVLQTQEKSFSLSNDSTKQYILYYEESYFDLSLNQLKLIYHEDYVTPINREIMIDDENNPYFFISPDNLKDAWEMRYVRVITKNQDEFDIMGLLKKHWMPILIGIFIVYYFISKSQGG